MECFEYRNGELFCEEVKVSELIKEFATPLYVYSKKSFIEKFNSLKIAFSAIDHLICYSIKSCSNLAILRILKDMGSGFDVVSGGELFRAEEIGSDMSRIVFAGVGKTEDEIEYGLEQEILMFNVESKQELERINKIAGTMGVKGSVSIRINPDVDPKTHKYITTGKSENKFGVDIKEGLNLYKYASTLKNIEIKGIQMHIGSQITDTFPYVNAIRKIKPLINDIKSAGIKLENIDIGGGLGINYKEEVTFDAKTFADAVLPELEGLGLKLIIEPGRFIAGNSGILLARVQYVKKSPVKNFVIIDAGMNDLLRPSLYGAYHSIMPVIEKEEKEKTVCDIVGPVCESGDFFAKDREIEKLKQGDCLAVFSAGAYGFVMSSNYNSRPHPAEILIDGSSVHLIRKREEYVDLIRLEDVN